MFQDFFSVIAARPDYTQDWPSYQGYIIESYSSWIGRRDDSYGLIFDKHLFHKFKMRNLVPSLLEQLRQPTNGPLTQSGFRSSSSSTGGSRFSGMRSRGRGWRRGSAYNSNRRGYQPQSFPSSFHQQQPSTPFRCYLCGGPHSHKEHQGDVKCLVANEQGKWVDKLLGNRIVCIAFNVGCSGCQRGPTCTYSHSCSLCGDLAHGFAGCAM